ncbi:uncharacterized protein ACR2FA_000954 [Aphomia sociella]
MGFKMRSLVLLAAITTSVVARPELYREKEDFQFSRSSSDDGTKSGYYDAQRGNMGGNYERAHNMDKLAQHQMSGLVRQVEGELGDGTKTRTGSVYSASNSRGIYGSGHYDLSNLQGRNFEEGESVGDNQLQSSLSNSAYRDHSSSDSNRYSNSYSRHSSSQQSGHAMQSSQMQNANNGYEQRESDAYDHMTGYRYHPQNRLVSTMPMRVMIRPGTKVVIPVAAQTYNAGHSASSYNENAFKSDAEELATGDQQTSYRRPDNNKHYESSYRYHKEWEKHDNHPSDDNGVSSNFYPKKSEVDVDSQARRRNEQYDSSGIDSQNAVSSNTYRYNSNAQSAKSSQSRHQSDYNSQLRQSSSNSKSNAFQHSGSAVDADFLNKIDSSSKPKSYQSSYSYHKSWERQGDPYVITPTSNSGTDGVTSQRLSDASNSHSGHSSHHYGSNYNQAHQSYTSGDIMDCDCADDIHSRVARSYNSNPEEYDAYQHRNVDEGKENLEQHYQSQWEDSQNLGQQTQNNFNQMEDFGQHSQNIWDKTDNLEQQSQTGWNQMEDLRQQTQNKWDKIESLEQAQNSFDKTENFGQQSQSGWDRIEDLGQQSQNQWDKTEDLGQQTQNNWDRTIDFGQHHQSDVSQQQDIWNKLENAAQHKHINTEQNQWYSIGTSMSQNEDNSGIQNQDNNNDYQFPTHISESSFNNFSTNRDMFNHNNSNKHNRHLSIWDKLDNFENINNINKTEHSLIGVSTTEGKPQSFEQDINTKPIHEPIFVNKVRSTTMKTKYQHGDNTIYTEDLGRGDIGPEEIISMEATTEISKDITNNSEYHSDEQNLKLVNHPHDIEVLSLTTKISSNETKHDSPKQQLLPINNNITLEKGPEEFKDIQINDNENNDQQKTQKIEHIDETKEKYTRDKGRQNKDFNRNNTVNQVDISPQIENGHELQNFDWQQSNKSTKHNITQVELEQNKNLNQQNNELQLANDQLSDNFNKQNIEPVSENFHQNENSMAQQFGFEQQGESFNQENVGLFDFGQQSESYHGQNVDNLHDFDQVNENSHGQNMALFDIGQQSENFNQKNVEQFDIGQQNENFNQQNMEELPDFGQQSQKFNQQNVPTDFGQQSENLFEQNMKHQFDIGQQNGNIDQENVEWFDIGQQNENINMYNSAGQLGQQNKNLNQQYNEQNVNSQQLFNQQGRNLDYVYSDKGQENVGQHERYNERSDTYNPKYSLDVITKQDKLDIQNSQLIPVENKTNNISSTIAPITETPGFWASVGNKFTSAKNKIGSWFKRS